MFAQRSTNVNEKETIIPTNMNFFTLHPALRLSFATALLCALSHQNSFAKASSDLSGITKKPFARAAIDSIPEINHAGTTLFCVGSEIIISSTLAHSYQWYKNGNPLGGAIFQNLTVASTGSYSVKATYSDSSTAMSQPILIRRATMWSGSAGDKMWTTAANWTCGAVPTQSDHVIIPESTSTPLISEEFIMKAASLELGELGSLTISSGSTLKITGEIKIHPTASFTINTDGSLLQTNDSQNSGNVTVERTTTPMKKYDYTYWSSPVDGQTLYG